MFKNLIFFLLFFFIKSQIFIALLSSNSSYQFGITWFNYTNYNTSSFKLVHSVKNVTSINLTNGNGSFLLSIPFAPFSNYISLNTLLFDSNKTNLLTSNKLFINISSEQYPNGEIGGYLKNVIATTTSTLPPITWKTWVTLSIIIIMLLVLCIDYFQPFYILFLTTIVLNIVGILDISDVGSSFASESILTVAALTIAVEPLQKTNLLNFLSRYIFGNGKWKTKCIDIWSRLNLLRMMLLMGLLSGFLNNTTLTILFTPIIKDWCRITNKSPSKVIYKIII
jgi:hypothetical protein